VRLLLPIVAIVGTAACCQDDTVSQSMSPQGRFRVIVTEQNCGATTDYVTFVEAKETGGLASSHTFFRLDGTWQFSHKWVSESMLTLEYGWCEDAPPDSNPSSDAASWKGLAISLRPIPLAASTAECRAGAEYRLEAKEYQRKKAEWDAMYGSGSPRPTKGP
jgi:hypothetical protein